MVDFDGKSLVNIPGPWMVWMVWMVSTLFLRLENLSFQCRQRFPWDLVTGLPKIESLKTETLGTHHMVTPTQRDALSLRCQVMTCHCWNQLGQVRWVVFNDGALRNSVVSYFNLTVWMVDFWATMCFF